MAIGFFDGQKADTSPESVRRKREMIARLMQTGRAPRDVGEGFHAIGQGLQSAVLGSRADAEEKANEAERASIMGGINFGGAPMAAVGGPSVATGSATGSGATRAAPEQFASLFAEKETKYGLPQGYLARTAQIESNFDPNAKNPNSSAGGIFQFIDGTARQYGLRNRFDPVEATAAAARLAADNRDFLARRLGRDPTAGELYLAHQQGAGGAAKLLSNPNAPAASVVGDAAARLNRGAGMTAGAFANQWTSKFGMPAVRPGAGAAPMPLASIADMPAPGANPSVIEEMPQGALPMAPGGGVPIANTEEDVQFLEARMAAEQGDQAPMPAPVMPNAQNADNVFSPIPMGLGNNPFVQRAPFEQPQDMPAPAAAETSVSPSMVSAPMPPPRPADLGPQSPFVPPAMRQPIAPMDAGENGAGAMQFIESEFARREGRPDPRMGMGAPGQIYNPFVQQPPQAPQMPAGGGSVPMGGVPAAQAQAQPQGGMITPEYVRAVMTSRATTDADKQWVMGMYNQQRAAQQADAERARTQAQNRQTARDLGLPESLGGVGPVVTARAQQMFPKQVNGQPKLSLQPVYGIDDKGNTVMLQPGEDGTAVQTQLPRGIKLAPNEERIDAGTKFIIRDRRTGQTIAEIPKDIAGVARQGVIGKDEGERIVNAPGEVRVADEALATINQIRNHPGREGWGAQGATAALPWIGNGIPGTAGRDFVALVDQAKGQAFLQAFESLKGGGQITNVEGDAATKARARLDRTQSREGFDQALKDIEAIANKARDRVMRGVRVTPDGREYPIGQQPPPSGQTNAPAQSSAALQNARKAIADGAPRQAVIDRLRQAGIDPGGL
jgi:hypothetical protein